MSPEEKLQAYEKMQDAIQKEFDSISTQMDALSAAGKTKSVTFKTLLGKKMMYKNMLSLYDIYMGE